MVLFVRVELELPTSLHPPSKPAEISSRSGVNARSAGSTRWENAARHSARPVPIMPLRGDPPPALTSWLPRRSPLPPYLPLPLLLLPSALALALGGGAMRRHSGATLAR